MNLAEFPAANSFSLLGILLSTQNLGEIPEQNRTRILAIGNFELFPGENLTVTRLGVNIP